MDEPAIAEARAILKNAEALLITAGAGMGVDSGLPDFRGTEGFWKAYPPYRHLGFNFMEMANPARFRDDPKLGWGFYGHRLHLYRDTAPHVGFGQLLLFSETLTGTGGCFVFTSNVDGHFQQAGFGRDCVIECHGSIQHFQCIRNCLGKIWPAGELEVAIDPDTMRARDPLPACPDCGALARPNVLMFGDHGWNPDRTAAQETRFSNWARSIQEKRLAILEFGAGSAVPTVRLQSERFAAALPNATLIRINPREPEIPADLQNGIAIAGGARETIDQLLG
jgi:NAD-dependent SIR2 family protein deacetylase